MTGKIVEIDLGLALLLPHDCAAKVGEVEIQGTLLTGMLVTGARSISPLCAEDWLSLPEYDNGLLAPDDPPAEPLPTF